ncbi:MAG: CHASE2 domain-containing protein, partial [Nitrospirae bacterium]|nr:CHASE2 domain-containing protein [Nitrospirota bacterium]
MLFVGIGFTLICTLTLIHPPIFLNFLNNKIYDIVLMSVHSKKTSGIPVVIDIDEQSLLQYGQWPWPRYRVALLLERLKSLGVSAVGIDILFAEPDHTSPSVLKHALKVDLNLDIGFTNIPDALRDNDKVFANTLSKGPFITAYKFVFEGKLKQDDRCLLHPLKVAIIDADDNAGQTYHEPKGVLCNLQALSEATAASGFFNANADRDGILRRVPLVMLWQGRYYPNLALATYLYAIGINQVIIKRNRLGLESIHAGDITIPVDSAGNMLVHFRGGHKTFPFYSAADVMSGKISRNALEGKIVLLGTSAAGLLDVHSTPFDQYYPGIETHATVIDTLLMKDFISQPGWTPGAEFLLVLVIGLVSTALFTYLRVLMSIPILISVSLALWFGTQRLMVTNGYYFSPLMPFLTLSNIFVILTIIRFRKEESRRHFLHSAFSKYVSGTVVDELVRNPQRLTLQGEERIVSILFCDIRDFTSISEMMTPTDVATLLKEYFTPMSVKPIPTNNI